MAQTQSLTKRTLLDFYPSSSTALKENAHSKEKGNINKETDDYCRDTNFKSYEDLVQLSRSCGARQQNANAALATKSDEVCLKAKPKKKKRKSITVPQPKGKPLKVNIPFNDGLEVVTIDEVCTDMLDDSSITLTCEYHAHTKRAAKNFLGGFGKFVW